MIEYDNPEECAIKDSFPLKGKQSFLQVIPIYILLS